MEPMLGGAWHAGDPLSSVADTWIDPTGRAQNPEKGLETRSKWGHVAMWPHDSSLVSRKGPWVESKRLQPQLLPLLTTPSVYLVQSLSLWSLSFPIIK